ncbi:MAG: hypothetical protein R3F22_01335 [Lysobacteraceae bacterium]
MIANRGWPGFCVDSSRALAVTAKRPLLPDDPAQAFVDIRQPIQRVRDAEDFLQCRRVAGNLARGQRECCLSATALVSHAVANRVYQEAARTSKRYTVTISAK